MENLRVAIIQEDLVWENPSVNQKKFAEYFSCLQDVDLVVVPEMFTTGFTMQPQNVAQSMSGATVQWIKEESLKNNFSLIGSIVAKQGENYFNRLVMSFPCSEVKWYDKRHLFRMGGEHEVYTQGDIKNTVFQFFGWRIRPLICYDLRFPVYSRNRDNYDLLIYVANWPASRNDVWQTLLKARAIENQCYVIGVNRVGTDAFGVSHKGNSLIFGPKGEVLAQLNDQPGVTVASLSLPELLKFREKFPVHLDADSFVLTP